MTDKIRWAFAKADQSPGLLLWQVYQKWSRQIAAVLKPFELTHIQFVLLTSIAWHNKNGISPTQAELAHFCNVDVNMTSQVIRGLEKREMLRRNQIRDARAKSLRLTDAGTQLVADALPAVEQMDKDFFRTTDVEAKKIPQMLRDLYASQNLDN